VRLQIPFIIYLDEQLHISIPRLSCHAWDDNLAKVAWGIGLVFLAPLSELENYLLLVVTLRMPNNQHRGE